MLAVQHLARAGELTPGQLSTRLQLSSGGTTGLIQRMQRAGHVTRDVHPRDARSVVLRLTPEIQTWAAEAWAPLVAEIDALVDDLSSKEAGGGSIVPGGGRGRRRSARDSRGGGR